MDLNEFILEVATSYDRLAGLNTPAQRLLKSADTELGEHAPGGIIIQGSGGKGVATFTPWVGFFDPDETTSPERGVYVVYLFAADLGSVTLTLNQGMTELTDSLGPAEARSKLANDAEAIRAGMVPSDLDGLDSSMQLGSSGFRQRAYEAGNIACKTYVIEQLPGEAQLRHDLGRFLTLYQLAVETKRHLLQTKPGLINTSSGDSGASSEPDPLRDFKPKSDADYVAYLDGRTLRKSRRHERLVADYGMWAAAHGWTPSTKEHPKDLVLRSNGDEWLVEAKVLYNGNATEAVRAALGQLYSYRHFLPCDSAVRLIGLFTEPIGDAYVGFLEKYGVASVWKSGLGWAGSADAAAANLTSV